MLNILNTYLIIGFIWLLLHEIVGMKIDNGMRIRLWLLWPFTLIAWVIGFINAFIDSFNNKE
jgi:hypothetical protein